MQWSEVRRITGISIDNVEVIIAARIAVEVDEPRRYYRPRGLYQRFTYGSMRNPLFFNVAPLDGSNTDLVQDFLDRVPEKIGRRRSGQPQLRRRSA